MKLTPKNQNIADDINTVQGYCAKQKTCENCVLYIPTKYGYSRCFYSPANWEIKKEGEAECC